MLKTKEDELAKNLNKWKEGHVNIKEKVKTLTMKHNTQKVDKILMKILKIHPQMQDPLFSHYIELSEHEQ